MLSSVAASTSLVPGIQHLDAALQADDSTGVAFRQAEIVNTDEHGNVFLVGEPRHEIHDLASDLGIEARRRLVDQQYPGSLHQGTRDSYPLALTAAELVGALANVIEQPDPIAGVDGALDVLAVEGAQETPPGRRIAEASRQYVLENRESIHQIEFLEDHAHPLAHAAQLAPRQARDLDIVQDDLPGRGLHQSVDAPQQGGLARAAEAEQCDHLLSGHFEIDSLQSLLAGRVGHSDVMHSQERHAAPPPDGRFLVHHAKSRSGPAFRPERVEKLIEPTGLPIGSSSRN